MKATYSSISQSHDDHYGSLLTQYIKTILESGLLLDEDYEVLLSAANFKIYPNKATIISFGIIASSLTTIGSVFLATRCGQPIVVLPSLTATIVLVCLKRREILKRKRRQEIVKSIVKSLIKLGKLNKSIIRYLHMRKKCAPTKEAENLLLYNENVEEFVQFFLRQYIRYFNSYLDQITFLVEINQELLEDYKVVKEIDVGTLLTCDNISIDTYDLLASRVQDIYTFLCSKYLNYLGITFSRNLKNADGKKLEVLLDKKLPGINATLEQLYSAVQKEFNNLRYCTSKKQEIDTKSRSNFSRQVSGKLQQTLIGAVNNLSIIMEKSQAVLEKVENMEDGKDVRKLESALADLRDHALATYESLDVLCKLYGILSNAKKYQDEKIAVELNKESTELSDNSAMVNYDDNSEAMEENYELFIPETEEADTGEAKERCEDQSGIYLSLMLKELRHSLKQHERFIAARNKRGIDQDDDEPNIRNNTKKCVAIPKFDLKACSSEEKTTEMSGETKDIDLPPVPAPRHSKLPPPPPPPLPPPQPSFCNAGEGDSLSESKRSLFDNIRTLSSQLKAKEDVFGADDCSDSD